MPVYPILHRVQTVELEHYKQLEFILLGQEAQVKGLTTETKYPEMQVWHEESLYPNPQTVQVVPSSHYSQ